MSITPEKEFITDLTGFGGMPIFAVMIVIGFVLSFRLGLQLLCGLLSCYALTIIIRILWFRRRPDKSKVRTYPWHIHLLDRFAQSSFPSLHTMRAMTWATLLAFYFFHVATFIVLGLVVLLAAFSRYKLNRHYVSDIIFGFLFGLIISGLLLWLL